jgi:Flp pilus assembly protein TadG
MIQKRYGEENGQTLVLIALLLVALLAFLGLVIDGGAVMLARRKSQDAADAAAFAGARVLALRVNDSVATEQAVWSAITAYAQVNGITTTTNIAATFINQSGSDICFINTNCSGIPSSPLATGVRVTTTLSYQTFFINVVAGNQPVPVRALASVQSGRPSAMSDLMPMIIKYPCSDINSTCFVPCGPLTCPQYQLFGDVQAGGNFQWTNYSSPCQTNTQDLVDYLLGGKSGGRVVADPNRLMMNDTQPSWVCGDTGVNSAKQVTDALDWWLAQPISDRHWIIPIVDVDNGGSGSGLKYHVIMFADFVPIGYDLGGGKRNPTSFHCSDSAKKCIMGEFFKQVESAEIKPGKCNVNGLDICGFGLAQ